MIMILSWMGVSSAILALGRFSNIEALYNVGAAMLLLSFAIVPA